MMITIIYISVEFQSKCEENINSKDSTQTHSEILNFYLNSKFMKNKRLRKLNKELNINSG